MTKFWMIANVDDLRYIDCDGGMICGPGAPEYVFFSKGKAEDKLLRLKIEDPDGKFYLLEAVAEAKYNLGGLLQVCQVE